MISPNCTDPAHNLDLLLVQTSVWPVTRFLLRQYLKDKIHPSNSEHLPDPAPLQADTILPPTNSLWRRLYLKGTWNQYWPAPLRFPDPLPNDTISVPLYHFAVRPFPY